MTRRVATFCPGLVFVLIILAPGAALAAPGDEANAIIDQWATTYTANDADALVKLYAADAILLGTVSPGIASDTAAFRSYFARLPGSGNKVAIGERRTVVLSDNAVVGTGFYDFTIMRDGKPVSSPARFTIVVVKRDGQWLIAHHHSSVRPQPPQ
jgi:uncharacterized protein (TIGR02246 family)